MLSQITVKSGSQTGSIPMVRVRNPWGDSHEWKGAWSDKYVLRCAFFVDFIIDLDNYVTGANKIKHLILLYFNSHFEINLLFLVFTLSSSEWQNVPEAEKKDLGLTCSFDGEFWYVFLCSFEATMTGILRHCLLAFSCPHSVRFLT